MGIDMYKCSEQIMCEKGRYIYCSYQPSSVGYKMDMILRWKD